MCGIAGIFGKDVNDKVINRMTYSLRKRGPDDFGLWHNHDKSIFLGHTRLSIIDVSEKGHQPMISTSGRFTIVFNGEIYNYRELKWNLKKNGAIFFSDSDTEVILWLWELWGEKKQSL